MLSTNDKQDEHDHLLVDPENNKEIRPSVSCKKTELQIECNETSLGCSRFDKFSQWTHLVRSIAFIKSVIRKKLHQDGVILPDLLRDSENLILRSVQQDAFSDEIKLLQEDVKPFPLFGPKDMLKAQWKCAQGLAEEFWRRWKSKYLHELQIRTKWQTARRNLQVGNLIPMKDQDAPRNLRPIRLADRIFPSSDGKIRKVEIAIVKDRKRTTYSRPITELVTLLEAD
ncbi:unnamed protein product [Mytilus coruscus]|uniref:DUF5641 domain-containing protein n=1 Tax=Mytilus coruscus TaxID=42192 RepID=A0A6J8E7S6_MYTCO|nr:unnamed protein product [Mytilus coruscus]